MTTENVADPATADDECRDCGYEPELKRTLGSFQVFAISFAFISVAVGVFSTYDELLRGSGPVGIWTWILAFIGQMLIALVIAQFAARIALSGSAYQWASRLANPKIGWFFGWLTFCYLITGFMAINSAMASQCLMPLFNMAPSENTARIITVVLMVIEAVLAIASTRIVAMINSVAVAIEVSIVAVLAVALLVAVAVTGTGSAGNLVSRGVAEGAVGLLRAGRRVDDRHDRRPRDARRLRLRGEHGRGGEGPVSHRPARHRGIGCRGGCSGPAVPDRVDRRHQGHPRSHGRRVARRGDHAGSTRLRRRTPVSRRHRDRLLRRWHGDVGQLLAA